ncbi:MAG: hypothetical protein JW790_01920, partial [Dehalococcoidales bacterium]|nr:hypothetical protein [Dehalococcoidales bacterium]
MPISNKRPSAEEEFLRYHNKLRSELNAAYWHFRVVEYIRELRGDYLRELNQTPSFWGLTIKAHVVSALTLLNRFFDKKEKVKHLHMQNFLDFIEQNKDIFSRRKFKKRLLLLGRYDDLAAQFNSEITTDKIEQDRQRLRDLPISSLRAW